MNHGKIILKNGFQSIWSDASTAWGMYAALPHIKARISSPAGINDDSDDDDDVDVDASHDVPPLHRAPNENIRIS